MPTYRVLVNPNEQLHKITGAVIVTGMFVDLMGLLTFNPTLLSAGFLILTAGAFLQVCCLERTRRYLEFEESETSE